MPYTLGTLKQRVAFELTNRSTLPSALDAEVQHALHTALQEMVLSVDVPAFRATGTFTTTAGQQDYLLDPEFVKMIEPGVRVNSTPYYRVVPIGEHEVDGMPGMLVRSDQTGRPYRYSLVQREDGDGSFLMRLYPKPDQAYPIQYRYYAYPRSLADADDDEYLDLRFPEEAVNGLLAKAKLHFTNYLSTDAQRRLEIVAEQGRKHLLRSQETVVGRGAEFSNRRLGRGRAMHGGLDDLTISDPYGT